MKNMDWKNKITVAIFIHIGFFFLFNWIATAKTDMSKTVTQKEGEVDVLSHGSNCVVAYWESKLGKAVRMSRAMS